MALGLGAVWEALAWAGPAPGEPQAWGLRRVASLEQLAHARPSAARSLTCAQERPAAPVAAGPAIGLGELVSRHLVEDASDTTVAFVPPPRGAGLGFPTRCSSTQAVQHQGPARTGNSCQPSPRARGRGNLSPALHWHRKGHPQPHQPGWD